METVYGSETRTALGKYKAVISILVPSSLKQTRAHYVETDSKLVKAELQSPSNADKQITLTSAASNHAVQDTEEMTGSPKLLCTATEAPTRPVSSQTAPLQTRSGRIVKPPDRLNL